MLEVHKRICGLQLRVYRASVNKVFLQFINLIVKYELRYDSSMMADIIPYALETLAGTIYEISLH